MFYYYGRKKKLAKHYPSAKHDIIIEPFAGAAAYSLHGEHWKKDVLLIEKDCSVYEVWDWLIDEADKNTILALPDLKKGEVSNDFFQILHTASKMAFSYNKITVTKVMEKNWNCNKSIIANNIHKIKHWKIFNGDYTIAPDITATWFIDPPYKGSQGQGYRHSSSFIDYQNLGKWILERKGQVIACESERGDYLPFKKLLEQSAISGKKNLEYVFIKG